MPVWLNSQEECRDASLANSILIENDVMGIAASTILRRFSGIRVSV